MFLCPKTFGKVFLHPEMPVGKNSSANIFKHVLHFHGETEPFSLILRIFLRGFFGVQKHFYGVQSDRESVVLAGYAIFQALVEKRPNHLMQSAWVRHVEVFIFVDVFSSEIALLCEPSIDLNYWVAPDQKFSSPSKKGCTLRVHKLIAKPN